jgi:hypothetical protein
VVISPDTLGRYVRIQNARFDESELNLAEVEVYSCGTPLLTSLTANPINGSLWELKGKLKRLGSTIAELYIEHGAGNYNTIDAIDITGINTKDSILTIKNIDIGSTAAYQFRLKTVTTAGTFYSNELVFNTSNSYCTPTLGSLVWFKTFNIMKYKGVETSFSTSVAYHNKTTPLLDSLVMNSSYTMEFRTPNAGWTSLSYKIYIDLNDDKLFTGYNELVGSASPAGQWTTVSFKIPNSDLRTGVPLRMRLQGYESVGSTSCYSLVGNFADYTVVVKNGPCTAGGQIATLYPDQDGDGYGQLGTSIVGNCASNLGYASNSRDFNDNDASIYPKATDVCDGKDNDNDGQTDEDGPLGQTVLLSHQALNSGTQRAEKILTGLNLGIEAPESVNFYAIKSIEILPGMAISKGSVFRAEIRQGCN